MSMNAAIIVSVLLAIKLILHSWLMGRQRRALAQHRDKVPTAFESFFTLEEHQKAADYGRSRLGFATLRLWFGVLLTGLWFFTGALSILDSLLFAFIPDPVWQPLVLIACVSLVDGVLSLPWSIYSQFVLEEKFGFNRTTLSTFFMDRFKGIVLGSILGVLIGYPLVLTMHNVPGFWFVPAFVIYISFQILIMWLWPTFIAPMFNKFEPLKDEQLAEGIKSLVEGAGFKSEGVFVMDASKRSTHGNAYFTGMGKAKRIVFFDTLLKKLKPEQTLAVLAHEVGHLAHGHIKKGLVLSLAMSAFAFMLLGWYAFRADIFVSLGLVPTHGVVLITAGWFAGLISFPLTPIMSKWSRKHEFEADRYAIERTSANGLGEALLELYRGNAGSIVVDPIYANWNYSHPPLAERLKAMPYPAEVVRD